VSRGIAIAALCLLIGAPLQADRLHLAGGGVIETGTWWVEGETLKYETAAGVVGLPRSMVLRVEQSAGAAPTPDERGERDVAPAEPAAASPEPTNPVRRETIRVPRPLGELLNRARAALDAGDHPTAAELYGKALEQADAELQLPRIGYALAQIAMDRDEAALSVVLDGLARDPEEPALLELLGDLYDRREQVPDALQAWKSSFDTKPSDRLRAKIVKAERELEAGRDYSLSTSAHFNMRYDREVDATLAREVSDFLERQYWVLADRFRHSPPQPITVLLYPAEQFRDVTQSPEWVGGLYDGKIRVPLGGLRRLNPAAEAVLTHELAHAVIHSKTRGQCPRWLHEGLAQIAEDRPLSPADRQTIGALLAQRDPARWNEGSFSYPMALSFTRHLESRKGLDGLVRLLERLGAGEELARALTAVYGFEYERLCREWAAEALEDRAG
jgi:tetratricopeptide (TPR) repeat protein